MKKILIALFVLALALSLAVPALAAPPPMVVDGAGLLSRGQAAALDKKLTAMSAKYLCDTVIVTVDSVGGDTLKDYMDDLYMNSDYGQGEDYDCLMLLIDKEEKSWRIATWGDVPAFNNAGLGFLVDRLYDELFEGDDNAALGNYADWCERFYAQALTGKPYGEGFLPPVGNEAPPAVLARSSDALPLLVDEAKLLGGAEAAALEAKLQELSDKWDNDIVILTVNSIGSKTPMEYADDYFDYNGYGRATTGDIRDGDGLLLLINMEERDWWVSTKGHAIFAFTDAGIEFLGKRLVADGLSDGDYAVAFDGFADWCDKFFARAETGKPYDKGRLPKTSADVGVLMFFAFVGGLIVAWIVTKGMKGKLKTVQKKQLAADYVRPGSLQVAYANEQFLYKNVTRVKQETSSSSGGGGSSTHSSSSGSSHGGGGGKF